MTDPVKADQGKPDVSLVPASLVLGIAEAMTFGATKYGRDNWRGGFVWSRVYSAVQRHLLAWSQGEDNDPESGLPHLFHAGAGIAFLIEYARTGTGVDDRPTARKVDREWC